MMRLHYDGYSCIVSSDLGNALMDHCLALARVEKFAIIDFPARDESGGSSEVRLVLGPASHLVTQKLADGETTAWAADDVPDAEDAVASQRLSAATATLVGHDTHRYGSLPVDTSQGTPFGGDDLDQW